MDFLPLKIDGKRVYAGFWKRFRSIWVDCFVLLPFAFLFAWLQGFHRTLAMFLIVPSTVLFALYSIYFNARFGGTLGKLAVGIRITKPNGEKIGWKEAWMRSFVDVMFALAMLLLELWALGLVDPLEYKDVGLLQRQKLLSFHYPWWHQIVFIGQQVWLWSEVVVLLLNRRKRALHDFIAGTVVVQKEFVGIMSSRTFDSRDTVNVRRSRLSIVLSVVLAAIVIFMASIVVFYSVWMRAGTRDCPPPDTSDLVIGRLSLPDTENAYTYFIAATNSLFWPSNSCYVGDILHGREENDGLVSDLIANNDETIEIIREGLRCHICQAPEINSLDDFLPCLSLWRSIAYVMALKARSERQAGQYAQSAQSCLDVLKFGGMIQADAESLIQYLVGVAVLELGFEQCRQLANASGPDESLLMKLSEQIGQLDSFDQGLIRSFKVEYKMFSNLIDDMAEGRLDLGESPKSDMQRIGMKYGLKRFFHPNATKKVTADHFRKLINNASVPYSKMKPIDLSQNELNIEGKSRWSLMMTPNPVGKILGDMLLPALGRVLERRCNIDCSAAATRLILACNVYRMRMNELPDTLESLVPKYVKSIPSDPYDGQPFKYSKSKAIVYSVGKDLKDSGGSITLLSGDETGTLEEKRWDAEDIVFQISNLPPQNLEKTGNGKGKDKE